MLCLTWQAKSFTELSICFGMCVGVVGKNRETFQETWQEGQVGLSIQFKAIYVCCVTVQGLEILPSCVQVCIREFITL